MTRSSLIAMAAERDAPCGFSATWTFTGVSPWPDAGETAIHGASETSVHWQSRVVRTVLENLAPLAVIELGMPESDGRHFTTLGAVACEIVLSVHPAAHTLQARAMPNGA